MRKEKKSSNSQQNKDKFLDKLLITLGIFLLAFIITMIVIFCVKDAVPDVLIERVLDATIWEACVTGAITICKYVRRKDNDKRDIFNDSEIDNNNSDGLDISLSDTLD